MAEPKITREELAGGRGRYVARIDGIDGQAEIIFSRDGPNLIVAEHTEVPDAFRGKGMGRLITARMVEDARKEGFKIYALCTFVNAERQKHADWADVFQTS
jgi:uncharacterized protein